MVHLGIALVAIIRNAPQRLQVVRRRRRRVRRKRPKDRPRVGNDVTLRNHTIRIRLPADRIPHRHTQIAATLRRIRQRRKRYRRIDFAIPLVIQKEERLVLHDRPAQRSAELILILNRPPRCRLKESNRVQLRVPEKVPGPSMKRIRPAPQTRIHRRSASSPKFRTRVIRNHPKLSHRIRRRLHHLIRKSLIRSTKVIVVDPIEQKVIRSTSQPIHAERSFALRRSNP